jgi:hypothetical protein
LFRLSIQRPSFRKTKKEDSEVSTTVTKVPRSGFLGKMGLKKKSKTVTEEPAEPKLEPVEEAPVIEKAPTTEEAPKDAPEDAEEVVEEREEEAEEAAEEPAEEAPVDEAAADEARDEAPVEPTPESSTPMSTGFLCGCV